MENENLKSKAVERAERNRQKFIRYKESMKSPLSNLTVRQLYQLEKELDIKFDLGI